MLFVFFYAILIDAVLEIQQVKTQARFACLSCSYTRSAIIEQGYDCIRSPNPANTISCTAPFVCKTIVVMDQARTHITSATRNCLPQTTLCGSDYCCNSNGFYSSQCEESCSENYCNTINGELFLNDIEGNPLLPRRTTLYSSNQGAGITDSGVTDGNANTNGNTGSGDSSTGSVVLNPDDLTFVHQDLFHVDIDSGTRFCNDKIVLLLTLCTTKLIVGLLY